MTQPEHPDPRRSTNWIGRIPIAACAALLSLSCGQSVPLGNNYQPLVGANEGGTDAFKGGSDAGDTDDGPLPVDPSKLDGSHSDVDTACENDGPCPQTASCLLCPGGDSVCPRTSCKQGKCVVEVPDCKAVECAIDDDCPTPNLPCLQCEPGTSCAKARCRGGECVAEWRTCVGEAICTEETCGSPCALCSPTQACGAEPGGEKYCNDWGECQEGYPSCELHPKCGDPEHRVPDLCGWFRPPCTKCPDGTENCPLYGCVGNTCSIVFLGCTGHDPCAGKACGEACRGCDPTLSADCVPTDAPLYCGPEGTCELGFPACSPTCKVPSDCLAIPTCTQCPEGKSSCPKRDCVLGHCVLASSACNDYEPCAGKECGAHCTLCDPAAEGCIPPATVMFCDKNGGCGVDMTVCD